MRRVLPPLVATAWLGGTALWLYPDRTLQGLGGALVSGELDGRFPEWSVAAWFLGLAAAMLLGDRLYCAFRRWRRGDPRRIHWSRLRNAEGDFLCAQCLSPFMLPPEDLDEEKMVRCGDCGAQKARYGEMKPFLDPEGALRRLKRRATGGLPPDDGRQWNRGLSRARLPARPPPWHSDGSSLWGDLSCPPISI